MRYEDIEDVSFNGVKISNVSYPIVRNTVTRIINEKQRGYICLNDVTNLVIATKNEQLRAAINASAFSLADGTPVVWYARIAGCREIERISGASLMTRLFADLQNCRHYLLGDTEQTIDKVIAEAGKLNSRIEISGHSPPFKNFDAEDNQRIIERIRKSDPDIIWVSFGGVKQEKWMHQNIAYLDRGIMIGAGAAFRFLAGDIITPPQIIQKMGLQWLFRLTEDFIRNPRILIKKARDRGMLKNKAVFLVKLPHEVKIARQQIKLMRSGKLQQKAE
ncbi:MAG TPA: WecB/TagA/CpsF family glycosyltransferase [Geobacteraceae bacterium]|nr:WecB/TagA/CpsF family glycosyltransferase [Geobacteraceae bacterium]